MDTSAISYLTDLSDGTSSGSNIPYLDQFHQMKKWSKLQKYIQNIKGIV